MVAYQKWDPWGMLYEAAQTLLTVSKKKFKLKSWACKEKGDEESSCCSGKKIGCNYA